MYGVELLSALFTNSSYNAKKIKIVFDFFISIIESIPIKLSILKKAF